METLDRRTFLKHSGLAAAGLMFAVPLQALAARTAMGQTIAGQGYGPLVDMGELALPAGFQYRVLQRQGDPMSDGNPTPGRHDGMAAFAGPNDTTILARNHENRGPAPGEVPVVVPPEKRYDSDPTKIGGVTTLVVSQDRLLLSSAAVLGGTDINCAGGPTPWGSWITCEETFGQGVQRHGYIFEVDANASGPVDPVPVKGAGRFKHEAVGWLNDVLYLTEDQTANAGFYRYLPSPTPRQPGDLANSTGPLQALKLVGMSNKNTRSGFPVGQPFPVEWVTIDEPDPATDTVRLQAQSKGAALFDRLEGCWVEGGRVYFDATSGGNSGNGQIWQFNPAEGTLTLIFESPGPNVLKRPDNLTVHRGTGDLFLCEDAAYPQYIRGLTPDGQIYDFARAITYDTEFAGACFDPRFRTLFVNQQGDPGRGITGVTYAIWGPWQELTPPTITSVAPKEGISNRPLNQTVRAVFSEPMDPATINTSTFTVRKRVTSATGAMSWVRISGTVTYDDAKRLATFIPTGGLGKATKYKVNISPAMKDRAGNQLDTNPTQAGAQGKVWYFTTIS